MRGFEMECICQQMVAAVLFFSNGSKAMIRCCYFIVCCCSHRMWVGLCLVLVLKYFFCVISSLTIISPRKKQLVALLCFLCFK